LYFFECFYAAASLDKEPDNEKEQSILPSAGEKFSPTFYQVEGG